MYKCCITGKMVSRHTAAHKVILAIQPVTYKNMFCSIQRGHQEQRIIGYTQGWNIVREGFISPDAIHLAPKLENLLSEMKKQKPIERVCYLKQRPGKKKDFSVKSTQIHRLRMAQ